jgi:hypothetical protein
MKIFVFLISYFIIGQVIIKNSVLNKTCQKIIGGTKVRKENTILVFLVFLNAVYIAIN